MESKEHRKKIQLEETDSRSYINTKVRDKV